MNKSSKIASLAHSNIYVPLLISSLLMTYFNANFKALLHITNMWLGKVLFNSQTWRGFVSFYTFC